MDLPAPAPPPLRAAGDHLDLQRVRHRRGRSTPHRGVAERAGFVQQLARHQGTRPMPPPTSVPTSAQQVRSPCSMWPCPSWTVWSYSSSCVPPLACRNCQRSFCRHGSIARPWRRRTAGRRLPGQALHIENLCGGHPRLQPGWPALTPTPGTLLWTIERSLHGRARDLPEAAYHAAPRYTTAP